MLKKFFLNTLSSFVGTWIALALFGAVAVIVAIGLLARFGASTATPSVSSHSILRIDLNKTIVETASAQEIDFSDIMRGSVNRPVALDDLVKGLEEGAANKNIDALYIRCGGASAGLATLDALRNAVMEFKKSGKKVYAYGDSFTMGDYYVASVADSVFLNVGGSVQMQGISGTVMYMKDLFDKLGVSFQIAKVGTFKSAVEPMILNEMSQPARAQLDTLYGNMWGYITEKLSQSRKKLSKQAIENLINVQNITFRESDVALKAGLVDRLVYTRQMRGILANLVGKDPEDLNFVGISDLVAQSDWGMAYQAKNRVAVLYAEGEIADGTGKGIDFMKLVPLITEFADDESVKALVLRVNSPGGSVFGSEEIGEALDYFMSKGKPLAVSMGDYAASGGYWISCCADRIFADPLTITGSIGIFGMFPNFEGTAHLLGVHPQTVSTNPQASFPTGFKAMDEQQMQVLQNMVEKGYDKFVARVAKGRKMPEAQVRRIAEGRVWDARTAVKLKLVDQTGSLSDAITWVAGKANLKDSYDVAVYPKYEVSFWSLLPSDTEMAIIASLRKWSPADINTGNIMKAADILARKPVQARMMDMTVGF